MSLSDRLAEARRPKRCRLGTLLSELDQGDRDALEHALAEAEYPSSQILRALLAEGHGIGKTTVQQHRNKDCLCSRTG